MPRGGRPKDRDGPERRCIVSGESGAADRLIRFVLGPDGAVVPDVAGRLPGRGMWLTASRDAARTAVRKRAFARAARAQVGVPDDLPDLLERLLAARLRDALAMARKAGVAVAGFEKVRARLRSGPVGALVQASDGAADGRAKLRALAGGAAVIDRLTGDELGLAFGRERVIHAALDGGGVADRALRDARRLSGFRPGPGAADEPASEAGGAGGGRDADRSGDGGPRGGSEDGRARGRDDDVTDPAMAGSKDGA